MFAYFIIVCIIIAVAWLIHHVCLLNPQLLATLNISTGIALSVAYHGALTAAYILLGAVFGLIATVCYISLKSKFD